MNHWTRRRRAISIALASTISAAALAAVPTPAANAATSTPSPSALVLYDTTGQWGFLGELDAMYAANLAGHFGSVTTEPVTQYTAGQLSNYTAAIYLGSTYAEPLPAAFTQDVMSSSTPVIWAGANVWDLGDGYTATNTPANFTARYGWDAGNSLYAQGAANSVTYKGLSFTRNALNNSAGSCGTCIINPLVTAPALVNVLASAVRTDGTTIPWAVRSANLTYIGEIPFSYVNETDRVLIFSDLLFDALAPATPTQHRALVRLEDVSPNSDPAQLRAIATDLHNRGVPFSINVIPVYNDPKGFNNNGRAQTLHLWDRPKLVSALKFAVQEGAVLNMEGYTHQYSNVANPYDGVTGDDFEFYRAQCSTTQSAPYAFESPCQNTDWVIPEGPVAQDSAMWAGGRILAGLLEMKIAGLPSPVSFVFPHYAASAVDYRTEASILPTRYDRSFYFGGLLSGGPINYSHVVGQFFPYVTRDVYGVKVLPENLGDYEPTAVNNNPPRTAADLVHNAQLNLAVRDGFASFFYDPDNGTAVLDQVVNGITALGYKFVSPTGI